MQGALTGHEDPSSVIALLEGGQVLLYDLTATTGQQAAPAFTPAPAALAEQRSGSPSKQKAGSLQQQPVPQQQQQQAMVPPPVQQLFKGQLQGKPLVTAARLRMIPIQPVPLRGLQVCTRSGLQPSGVTFEGHDSSCTTPAVLFSCPWHEKRCL